MEMFAFSVKKTTKKHTIILSASRKKGLTVLLFVSYVNSIVKIILSCQKPMNC